MEAVAAPGGCPAPTFADFVCERYFPHAALHLKPSTLRDRAYTLVRKMGPILGPVPIDRINLTHVEEYQRARLAAGMARTTVNTDMMILSAVLRYARDCGIPTYDFRIRPLRLAIRNAPPVLDADQVQAIFRATAELYPEKVAAHVFLANTGCRPGEVIALEWDWLHLAATTPFVRVQPVRDGSWEPKSRQPRDIPLGPAVLPYLEKPNGSRWVFPHPKTRERYSAWWQECFRYVVRRARSYADVPSRATAKWFRHTYATTYLLRGGTMWSLSRILGHSTIRTTERMYAHVCEPMLAENVGRVAFAFNAAA